MIHGAAFDVCEMGAPTYVLARERGVPLTALPVLAATRRDDRLTSVVAGDDS